MKSGQLSTGEAAKLERGEPRIDRMESKALKDGILSQQEATSIQGAQNRESETINRLKHNEVTGNPNSASSQRMQANVQRNINQQRRIERGVQSGALTKKEVSQLERGQARVGRAEARAGAEGHVGVENRPASRRGRTIKAGKYSGTSTTIVCVEYGVRARPLKSPE